MAFSSLQALLIVLLACILRGIVAETFFYEQDGGKCVLLVEDSVEVTIPTIEHNGHTANDVVVTIDTMRGYKCKQGYATAADHCNSAHMRDQDFYNYYDKNSNQLVDKMGSDSLIGALCTPDATNDVTEPVDVQVGPATVSVNVVWKNITSCECSRFRM